MLGSFISKVSDLQKQVEASFEEALHYDPESEQGPQDASQQQPGTQTLKESDAEGLSEPPAAAESAIPAEASHVDNDFFDQLEMNNSGNDGLAEASGSIVEAQSQAPAEAVEAAEEPHDGLGDMGMAGFASADLDLGDFEDALELPDPSTSDAPADSQEAAMPTEELATAEEEPAAAAEAAEEPVPPVVAAAATEEPAAVAAAVVEQPAAEEPAAFAAAEEEPPAATAAVEEPSAAAPAAEPPAAAAAEEAEEPAAAPAAEAAMASAEPAAQAAAEEQESAVAAPALTEQAEDNSSKQDESSDAPKDEAVDSSVGDTFEAQVQVLRDFYAVHDPGKTPEQIRGIVEKRKKDAPALTGEAFDELCSQIASKYGEDPRRPGVPCAKRSPMPTEASPALFGSSWLQPAAGANILQTLQGAVEGVRDTVEKSLEEARQHQSPLKSPASPAEPDRNAVAMQSLQRLTERIEEEEEQVSWDEDFDIPEGTVTSAPEGGDNQQQASAEARPAEETDAPEHGDDGEAKVGADVDAQMASSASGTGSCNAADAAEGSEEFERQVTMLADFYAVYDPGRTEDQVRAIVSSRKGDAHALTADQLEVLCSQIQAKYGVDPRRPNSPSAAAAKAALAAGGPKHGSADSAGELLSSWLKPAASSSSTSMTADGLFASGLRTLQTLQGAAEGLRENVERSFDEAIRSQEDTSALDAVHSLREGWRDAVEKAAVQPGQEASSASTAVPVPLSATPLGQAAEVAVAAPAPLPVDSDEAGPPGASISPRSPQVVVAADPAVQAERDRLSKELAARCQEVEALLKELNAAKEDKKNLIAEGMRMSKRVHAVEERMKEAVAEARRLETRNGELEKIRDQLQTQVSKMITRGDDAEATCNEQGREIRRLTAELERSRGQLIGEQRRCEAEQQAQQQRSREIGDRTRQFQEKLESAMRECNELRATNASLTQALESTRGAIDFTESQYQQQLQDALQANEEQRRRLEAVEMEYASQSLPLTRRIADLETRLSKQEQQHSERLAASQREADTAISDLAKIREEMRAARLSQDKEQEVLREQVKKSNTLVNEMAETLRLREADEAAAVQARDSAERSREAVDSELRLEKAKRQSEEQRVSELKTQVTHLTQQLEREQAAAKVARMSAPQATAPSQAQDSAVHGSAPGAMQELDVEARRLRMEVDGLMKQRERLERESATLQEKVDSLGAQAKAQNGKANPAHFQLETRFEAALQAIGKLQEDLEVCQEQRDQYKKQCHDLAQAFSKESR